MYASDVIRRNRNATLLTNLQRQRAAFNSGLTNQIVGQQGGNDYQFIIDIAQAQSEGPFDTTSSIEVNVKQGNRDVALNISNLNKTDFTGITDSTPTAYVSATGNKVLDDSSIPIPMGGMDFYFFGTNHGLLNTVYWNSNCVITFKETYNLITASFRSNTIPAILLGNMDRATSELYYGTNTIYNLGTPLVTITTVFVYFSDYYTDSTNFEAGKYRIRFIRESAGQKRQWVEVSVISTTNQVGYSNNNTVTYPSGNDASGNPMDSNGVPIDPTKNSPYDITDGTTFQNVAGTTYVTSNPPSGTSLVYQSDSMGMSWLFINNAYVDI